MSTYTLADMMMQSINRTHVQMGALEVNEDAQGYTVHMVVPGIAPEQIDITVTGRTLTIKAEAPEQGDYSAARPHVRALVAGRVARRIEFPLPVDGDAIHAHSEHGILTVRVPKSAAAQPKRILVNGAPQIAE
jgi:HSP20 family protein